MAGRYVKAWARLEFRSSLCCTFHNVRLSITALCEASHNVGKMQFYLAVLDDTVRIEGESPSIGILICKSNNRTIVEYALTIATKPIGVATYRMGQSVAD